MAPHENIHWVNRLVAHRGEPDNYPENSLQGFQVALSAGAKFIETDIQITKDDVAILSHDASLLKITGKNILVSTSVFDDIKHLSAGYQTRFSDQFSNYKISTLESLCGLLSEHSETTCFFEIKEECIFSHGNKAFDIIHSSIKSIAEQSVVISFNESILHYARKLSDIPVGWVIPEWNDANQTKARQLNPDYLFCNTKRLPDSANDLWQGDWQWAAYTVNNVNEIKSLGAYGMELFESNDISTHIRQLSMQD